MQTPGAVGILSLFTHKHGKDVAPFKATAVSFVEAVAGTVQRLGTLF